MSDWKEMVCFLIGVVGSILFLAMVVGHAWHQEPEETVYALIILGLCLFIGSLTRE